MNLLSLEAYSIVSVLQINQDYHENFHREHEWIYGYANRDKDVEIVNIRIRGIGKRDKMKMLRSNEESNKLETKAYIGIRDVVFNGKELKTKVYDRSFLKWGNKISGPAVIVEYSSTTVIPPFASCYIDAYRNIIIEI